MERGLGRQAIGLGLAAGVVLVASWLADAPLGPAVALAGGAMGWLLARAIPVAAGATVMAAPVPVALPPDPVPAPPPLDPAPAPTAPVLDAEAESAAMSSLRHDLRGILSPAMLIADRLQAHEDPAVQKAGSVVARTVDRASARLAETKKPLIS